MVWKREILKIVNLGALRNLNKTGGKTMTHIMVIDINATTSYRIKKLVENIPVEVISVSTVFEAINRANSLQVSLDIIIIDVNLGSEDGYDLITKLKEINENLMVIIATSLNTRKSFVRAIRVGANDYVLKPFDDDYMKTKLLSHIQSIDQSKSLPNVALKQADAVIYNAIKKAIREKHELLVGLILVYNKKTPIHTNTNVRDLSLIKGLSNELKSVVQGDDEVLEHGANSFVIVLHKKSIQAKEGVKAYFSEILEGYFINRAVDDFSYDIEFINLPSEIDPSQNALTVLAKRIEKNIN